MSTIGSIGSSGNSNAWAQVNAANQSRMQNRLLKQVDADGSGIVDGSELQTALDTIAKKTGVTFSTTAADVLAKADTDGNGSLGAAELDQALQSLLPPSPSTMAFAQSRASAQDATASGQTDSTADFAGLDTDGNGSLSQSEFNAGRTQGGAHAAGGMPPPPPHAAGGSGSANDTRYDPLDTNQDGVVSAAELAAASASGAESTDPLKALFDAVDTDGDQKISASETDALAQQVATALETLKGASSTASSSSTSSSGTGSGTGTDSRGQGDQPLDLRTLAQQVLKQYEAIANNLATTGTSALNATA
ncbi:MAG: hypothetical protein JWP29_4003 [Rhodoferax sp.]|nr:hypothetical protein [Rhodoferax sp.]